MFAIESLPTLNVECTEYVRPHSVLRINFLLMLQQLFPFAVSFLYGDYFIHYWQFLFCRSARTHKYSFQWLCSLYHSNVPKEGGACVMLWRGVVIGRLFASIITMPKLSITVLSILIVWSISQSAWKV
jgi:hypothetical protein